MPSPEFLAKAEAALTKEDWQYIQYAVQERILKADKKIPGERSLRESPEWKAQKDRLLRFLNAKAFG